MNNKTEIELVLLQELIDYLQLKPYNEVSQLIQKIVQSVNKEKE